MRLRLSNGPRDLGFSLFEGRPLSSCAHPAPPRQPPHHGSLAARPPALHRCTFCRRTWRAPGVATFPPPAPCDRWRRVGLVRMRLPAADAAGARHVLSQGDCLRRSRPTFDLTRRRLAPPFPRPCSFASTPHVAGRDAAEVTELLMARARSCPPRLPVQIENAGCDRSFSCSCNIGSRSRRALVGPAAWSIGRCAGPRRMSTFL